MGNIMKIIRLFYFSLAVTLSGFFLNQTVSSVRAEEFNYSHCSTSDDKTCGWTDLAHENPKGTPVHLYGRCCDDESAVCGDSVGPKTGSPVDISRITEDDDLKPVRFDYKESALNLQNNGHNIQAVNWDSSSRLEFEGDTYVLKKAHYHVPSEHTLDGESADMELHLVHGGTRDKIGSSLVVAVLLDLGSKQDPLLAQIIDTANLDTLPRGGDWKTVGRVNAKNLIPAENDQNYLNYWTYLGSLTTPPCSSSVRWIVLKDRMTVTASQMENFAEGLDAHVFPEAENHRSNVRPTQPLHGREVSTP